MSNNSQQTEADASVRSTDWLGSLTPKLEPCDRPWSDYPIGTRAHSCTGGYWERVRLGWKWCNGSTFPTPGGSACGACVELPNEVAERRRP